jgi:signal transduction histidine kinase
VAEVLARFIGAALMCAALWHTKLHAEVPLYITTAEILLIPGRGYTPPPYEADVSGLPGTWQAVDLPHTLPRQLIPGIGKRTALEPPTVVTWYWLKVPALATDLNPRYLYIPRWKTDGTLAVYGDKRLLFQSHASVSWNGWNIPLWIPLENTADSVLPGNIYLRIERPLQSGGGISSVWLGESDGLSWRYRMRYFIQVQLPYASSTAFLAVGIFSLFVWFRLRTEKEYFLFFGISAASFLRTLHFYVGESDLPISDEWFTWITINSLFWMVLITHFFLNYLHRQTLVWLNRVVIGVSIVIGILTLPFSPDAYALSSMVYTVLLLMGSSVAGFGYFQSRRAHSHDGLLLSTWAMAGMLAGGYDWLMQSNYISIEGIYLGSFSNIVAFLIFMHIIFCRYVAANAEVKQVNASLQLRLQVQENVLLESHQRLREIAHRQTLSDERQRLMQDMHDGMGSSLRTALLAIERGQIDPLMVAEVLKDCIDDLKLAIDSMEPLQADLLLLLATLRFRLGPRLESAGIVLRWEIENVPALDWIDPRNALHILRILQEAFTNIIKHTQATEIRVMTGLENGCVVVKIIDNGAGFSVATGLGNLGKGLSNQMRRAESIGAEIHWTSGDAGTCVSLRLPIKLPAISEAMG